MHGGTAHDKPDIIYPPGGFCSFWHHPLHLAQMPPARKAGMCSMAENYLYFGDNLDILRRHVKDEIAKLLGLIQMAQKNMRRLPF